MITTPNKEIVRRICILHGATYCYMLVKPENGIVRILVDSNFEDISGIADELLAWCGIRFEVITEISDSLKSNEIIKRGEKILPISFT